MTTLGPLTTIFIPSPSCTTYAGYTELADPEGGSYLVKGPLATDGCYPSGFKPAKDYYYTPGQCPSGYTVGGGEAIGTAGATPTYANLCCPVIETGTFRAVYTSSGSSNPLPSAFLCTQIITNTTSLLPVTQVSAGLTSSFISTITAATIGAYGVRVVSSDGDKLEKPLDPERFNNARLTFGNQALTHDRGLGPEMKVGFGVGICAIAGLIAFGVLLLLERRRKSRRHAPKNDDTLLSHSHSLGSGFHTQRKPFSSVQSSDMSARSSSGDEEYHAVSMSEVPNNAGNGASQPQEHRRQLFDGAPLWTWEMLSLFVSALSLASIIIILDVYQNRELDEWTPKVSINAVISVLSAVFKGSLAMPVTEGISQLKWLTFAQKPQNLSALDVYDRASRSIWGSAMMIFGQFRSETRTYLASIGAALAIIALATDPFAQATMSFYSCARNGTEIASIPRANTYSVTNDDFDPTRFQAPFNKGMQLALYRGLIEPPARNSSGISISCATGNCTFPEDGGTTFTSLAMCSRTWDITDRIRPEKTKDGYDYILGPDNSLSFGHDFNMSYVEPPKTTFKDSAESLWNRTSVLDVYIMSMKRVNSTDCKPPFCRASASGRSTTVAYSRPVAFVFSLLPCVQTFHAEMSHGHYSERVISEEYLHFMPQNPKMWQLAMNRSMINGKWQQCSGTVTPNENNTVRIDAMPAEFLASDVPHSYYTPECVFEFYAGYYLAVFLGMSFFTPVTAVSERPGSSGAETPPWEAQLWNNGNTTIDVMTEFVDGLARSITAQMRTDATGPEMLREARGMTVVEKTCIRIHWGYITFFATMFMLEVLFLGTVMVIGSRSRLHTDWKSSALAVAFLSAGESQKGGWPVENPESEESLQQAARSIKASLMLDDVGHWRLQVQEKS